MKNSKEVQEAVNHIEESFRYLLHKLFTLQQTLGEEESPIKNKEAKEVFCEYVASIMVNQELMKRIYAGVRSQIFDHLEDNSQNLQ